LFAIVLLLIRLNLGAQGAIRTHTVLVLSEVTPASWSTRASNWWVPGDSNPDSPKGNTVLQAGAASRIRLAPKKLAEGLGVEPSRAISDACRVSSAVASRPPRPLKSGAGAVIRTLCASFGGWLLSQEHPGILGRGRRNRTPLAHRQSTAFETARRPFTGALCTSKFGAGGEIRTLTPEGTGF
jgi:hypothetical protein